jgi:uncharacterized membrane protein
VEEGGLIESIYFSSPQLLWLIPAILALGLAPLLRAKSKILVLSRLLVLCLVLAAAANPYVVTTHMAQSERPSITILADRTSSMSLFDPDVATRLSQVLADPQIRSFSGDSTPLGDMVLQQATPGSAIVLVSDGYSNVGRPLADSVALAKASNVTVFAIDLSPNQDDASVEIMGTNTAVLGGDFPFTVLVRSAGEHEGTLSVYADEALIYSGKVVTNRSSSIKISHTFFQTGTHILRASLSPDFQAVNNEYQKAVYVVPKPDVLLLSGGPSPLATVLSGLYKLTRAPSPPGDLRGYKAVVLDDRSYRPELEGIKGYVRDGGGLVVVGGPSSYELGGYYNSALEEVLPVRSVPSTFEGGKAVVLLLDISYSLQETRTRDGTPLIDYEKALAVELLSSPDFQDYRVGVVVFGTKAYVVSSPIPLSRGRTILEERIASLSPSGPENTYLDSGLQMAWEMLNKSGEKGELIVLSDGNLWSYEEVFLNSIKLIKDMNISTRLIQVEAYPDARGRFHELAAKTGVEVSSFTYPSSLTTKVEAQMERRPEKTEPSKGYPLAILNRNHYITSDLSLNATVQGFNDVTPRPGSQRLVAMADGKPVLTAWRYGLGRAASLTTDDGKAWAPAIYEAANSRLISATVNWAVGDPRPEINRIDAEDGWLGTPLKITILSDTRPRLGDGVSMEKVGEKRYTATLNPSSVGVYYVGDYGIAVNYPLEYRDVGFNPELPRIIMANGGRVFTEAEARSSLTEEARRMSQRIVQERVSRRDLLLFGALAIFLGEVIWRRWREMRKRGHRPR